MSKNQQNETNESLDTGIIYSTLERLFKGNPMKAYRYRHIVPVFGPKVSSRKRHLISEAIRALLDAGVIVDTGDGAYRLTPEESEQHEGKVVTMVGAGAFITVEGLEKDVFVTSDNLNNALPDDIVRLALYEGDHGGRKRMEGIVTGIVERSRKRYVGVVELSRQFAFISIDSKGMPYDIFVPLRDLGGAQADQKVVVEIVEWPESSKNPIGRVVEVLGRNGENDTEMHAILAEYDLPSKFDASIERAAEAIPSEIPAEEYKKRRDFRDVTTFTIDPFDAKDFDDAISIRRLPNGNRQVGIHIADVSHYVTPDSVLDKEAVERATSVYLVDRVVPMLPEKLSNELCSLRPHEEKLCFSAVFELDGEAQVKDEWFGRTVIYSDRRFTYEEAQLLIEGGEGDFKEEMLELNRLAQTLRRERYRNGSIAFERDEAKFNLDENGKPLGVYFKVMKESNQLVEEFMLLANRKVAEFIGRQRAGRSKRTFVYRVHDKPNADKFSDFCNFIAKFGYSIKAKTDRGIARELNKLLEAVKGKTEENLFSTLAIRTMAKAVYSTDNIGHYGLAFDYYTHFTSPIRRYPDIMVHRLLQRYLDGGRSADREYYEELCDHSTEREIKASEAERASIKYKMVEYMVDKVGEEFDGIISGVTEWGIYVELCDTKIEGMVSVREMRDDFYTFDEENYRLIGNRRRQIFTLGDKVRIKVLRTDLKRKQLDFELVAAFDPRTGGMVRLQEEKRGRRKKH